MLQFGAVPLPRDGQNAAGLDKIQQNGFALRGVEKDFLVSLGQFGLGLMLLGQLLLAHFRYLSDF